MTRCSRKSRVCHTAGGTGLHSNILYNPDIGKVNKKHLIKTIISHLPFYNWAFANSPLYLG